MKTPITLLLLIVLMLGATALVQATAVPVTNSGFELPPLSSDDTTSPPDTMTGWLDFDSNPGVWGTERLATSHMASGQPRAIDGNQVAYTNNGPFTLQQSLVSGGNPVNLTANTVYTLSIYIGDRLDTSYAGYTFGLYTTSGTLLVRETDVVAPSEGSWEQRTIQYTALGSDPNLGQQLQIRFGDTGLGQTIFDEVSLDASPSVVPEPSTMLLPALVCLYFASKLIKRREASR